MEGLNQAKALVKQIKQKKEFIHGMKRMSHGIKKRDAKKKVKGKFQVFHWLNLCDIALIDSQPIKKLCLANF
jgi:hypothetical protein